MGGYFTLVDMLSCQQVEEALGPTPSTSTKRKPHRKGDFR